jgi:hypothetical protein
LSAVLLSVSDADRAAFHQHNDVVLVERLRRGLYLSMAVGLVLVPATWFADENLPPKFLLLPVVASVVMVTASMTVRRPGAVATALYCGVSYTVAILGALVATGTGGFESPYFLIHMLICSFVTAILPLSPWRLLLVCLPNTLLTPAILFAVPPPDGTPLPELKSMHLPVLMSACQLAFAYLGAALRYQVDLQAYVAQTRLAEARASLAALNGDLTRRVEEQVGEIVRRADDINALNAQLREKVQARSRELAQALRALNQGSVRGTLEVGTVLGGRVVLEGVLGVGGMGTVYAGQDRVSGRRVAVKVMSARVLANPRAIQRFLAEAEAAAAIAHPGIVKTLHVDVTAEGLPFLMMEYVEGAPLNLLARHAGRLAPGLVARIGEAVARALAAAHAVGVVHRDVKPSNVMIAREAPAVRLLDFGVSKIDRSNADAGFAAPGLTSIGALIGTPAYMAPEQVLGSSAVTPACDVYSLGVVLHELAAGRHPFAAREGSGLLVAHATEEAPRLDEVDPGVPAELARLVAAAMAKAPSGRPGAPALADALARLTRGAPEVHTLFEPRDIAGTPMPHEGHTTEEQGITGLTPTAP